MKRNRFANKCKIKQTRLKKCDENSKFAATLNATARRLRDLFSFRITLIFSFDNDFCNCENRKQNCSSLDFYAIAKFEITDSASFTDFSSVIQNCDIAF